MPIDRTEKQIRAIEAQEVAGKITAEESKAKREKLKKAGSKWYARLCEPTGKEIWKRCTSKAAAVALERKWKVEKAERQFTRPSALRVTLREVLRPWLERQQGRGGFASARSICERANLAFGDRRLDEVDENPEGILDPFFAKIRAVYSEKTAKNHKVVLRAAIAYYIKRNRLRILNPLDIVEVEPGFNRREVTVEMEEYLTLRQISRRPRFPQWLESLFVAAWEHGLRMGEYSSWRWEWVTLSPAKGELPWLKTLIQKQGIGRKSVWREIPLSHPAAEALRGIEASQKETGRVFPVCRTAMDKWVRKAMVEASFDHLKFHDFRRSWKRRHLSLPQHLRMEAQGHKTEDMDSYYMVLKRKELEEIVRGSYSAPGLNPGQESEEWGN